MNMRRRTLRRICATLLALSVSSGIAHAAPVLINFDDIQGMTNAPGTLVPLASQLSDDYLATTGALFSSTAPYVAVVTLGSGHAISAPDGIGGVNATGGLSYASPIFVTFFEVGSGLPGVTDFVSIRGDQIAIAGSATLTAFGLDNSVIGSVTANDVSGGLTLSLALQGIHRVSVTETSATIAFDNLQFNAPVAVAVPEPSSLILFATATLACAKLRNRNRKKGGRQH